MKKKIPRVALMLPFALKGYQDMLNGLLQYVRQNGPWQLFRMEGRLGEQRLGDLRRWGCSGILTTACSREEALRMKSLNVPIYVCEPSPEMLTRSFPLSGFSYGKYDSRGAGVMAADYFLQRGFRNFAFVGDSQGLYWSQDRLAGYRETLQKAGHACHLYAPPVPVPEDWTEEQSAMEEWLKALPKPIAVFAAMDGRARLVLDACMSAEIAVPDTVAVLGVDNDELLCESTFPSLSSIEDEGSIHGFEIAQCLDALMRNPRLPPKVCTQKPIGVVTRRSTDILQIPDPQAARALEFILKNGTGRTLHVPDVVKQMGMSRRLAEIRFRAAVGRTILEEILRVRFERVTLLLAGTNLSIGEIAERCGFARESYLSRLFFKRYKMTMTDFRRR